MQRNTIDHSESKEKILDPARWVSQSQTYKGEINPANTLRSGYGSYIFPNAFFRYEGDYLDGVKHGRGKLIMNNRTIISALFDNNQIVGEADIRYGNGDTYIGGYDNGEKNGKGVFKSLFYTYEGEYLSNMFHGDGYLVDYTKQIKARGSFSNHKMHGKMVITNLIDKLVFDGVMKEGKEEGYGTLRLTDASGKRFEYDGYFSEGMKDGFGTFKELDLGIVYKGEFKRDKIKLKANDMHVYLFDEEEVEEEIEEDGDKQEGEAEKMKKVVINEIVHEDATLAVKPGETKFNLRIKVVYQPPEYPDPNPPPPDAKKVKAKAKKKTKKSKKKKGKSEESEDEEEEIPMIKPPAVQVTAESGRLFKIEFLAGTPRVIEASEAVSPKNSKNDKKEEERPVLQKFDFRKEFAEMRKKQQEHEMKLAAEQEENEKKGNGERDKKDSTKKLKERDRKKGRDKGKGSKKNVKNEESTVEFDFNFFNDEIEDSEKVLIKRSKNGEIVLRDLELPENYPNGPFFFRVTDITDFQKLSRFVGTKVYCLSVGGKGGDAKGKKRGRR